MTSLKKRIFHISNVLRLENIRTTEKMRIVADGQQIVRVDWDMNDLEVDFSDDLINYIAEQLKILMVLLLVIMQKEFVLKCY